MSDDQRPKYGYGLAGRPLWSGRDRDAEAIRRVLRRAGYRDGNDRSVGHFAVEGANASLDEHSREPYFVACTDMRLSDAAGPRRFALVLRAAGYDVTDDPDDDGVLIVQPVRARRARWDRPILLIGVLVVLCWVGTVAVSLHQIWRMVAPDGVGDLAVVTLMVLGWLVLPSVMLYRLVMGAWPGRWRRDWVPWFGVVVLVGLLGAYVYASARYLAEHGSTGSWTGGLFFAGFAALGPAMLAVWSDARRRALSRCTEAA